MPPNPRISREAGLKWDGAYRDRPGTYTVPPGTEVEYAFAILNDGDPGTIAIEVVDKTTDTVVDYVEAHVDRFDGNALVGTFTMGTDEKHIECRSYYQDAGGSWVQVDSWG